MVQAYCTLLGQPNSLPPTIHCIYQGMQIMSGSATILFGRDWATVVAERFGKEGGIWKGRYEMTVVYSEDGAATKPP